MTSTAKKIAAAHAAYERYAHSHAATLSDVYGSYSERKEAAYESILREMNSRNGFDMRIISHTVYFFTCGYEFPDPDTGVVMFAYHTPTYSVVIESPIL